MAVTPVETAVGLLMILTSVPVYFLFVAWKTKPQCFIKVTGNYYLFRVVILLIYGILNVLGGATRWLQTLLMVVGKAKSSDV